MILSFVKRLKKTICFSVLLFIFSSVIQAQQYFQQDVNYKINVRLNDSTHELTGFEELSYTNNSSEKLKEIYFHLWPNAYKNNTTALAKQLLAQNNTIMYFAKEEDFGYIDQLKFKVNGKAILWNIDSKNIDICKLMLNEPLQPGQTIIITTPFHVKIPNANISRLGHLGQSYMITQWFPKPAVYDVNGWNAIPYLHQGEFYSEYGTFDVYITLPKNYVVGATGDLVNGEMEQKWLNENAEKTSKTTAFNAQDMLFPVSEKDTKTLHFHQEKVHDFAWFADKRFHVLKGEVELPNSKRKVATYVMFTNASAKFWMKAIPYVNDAIYYYSKWIGEYPYNQATAIDGTIAAGGGMEYPNITVIGSDNSDFSLETVIMHEVGHNWFYGILGTNERSNPWMDEGINTFYEGRYIATKYPNRLLTGDSATGLLKFFDIDKYKQKKMYELAYLFTAKKNQDQAINLHSERFTMINYGAIVYSKTGFAFNYLKSYLGEELYDKAMQRYFEEWKYKHPQPNDLRKIFETTTNKDLSWFFDDVLKTNKKIDYKVVSLKKSQCPTSFTGNCDEVKIKNKGQIAGPFPVSVIIADTIIKTEWHEGFKGKNKFNIFTINYHKLCIDANNDIPEINRKNNTIRRLGILKKIEPLRLQFLGSLDNQDKTQLFFFPALGWNSYDGWMPGMMLYNHFLFDKKLDYTLVPLYSTKTKHIAGIANIGYTIFPQGNLIEKIRLSVNANHFTYSNLPQNLRFIRVKPELRFFIKNNQSDRRIHQEIKFNSTTIFLDSMIYTRTKPARLKNCNYTINMISYIFQNNQLINPYNFNFNLQQNTNFFKATFEANYSITYSIKNSSDKGISLNSNKSLDIRFFAGKFLWQQKGYYGNYNFKMSGTNGYDDYLLEHIYPGRQEYSGFWSYQFVEDEGGFKTNTGIGSSNKWITALNIETSLPWKIPIKLFADIGTYANAKNAFLGSNQLIYDAGISLTLIPKICSIYFPLLMSDDLHKAIDLNTKAYWERIRFSIRIEKLNIFEYISNFEM